MSKDAECIRTVANWSHVEKKHLFDSETFDLKAFRKDLPLASPKLETLVNNILQLDANDMEKDGKLYKHMIFTDIKNAQYGAKIVASGLISNGFHHVYNKTFTLDEKTFKSKKHESKNFAVICSTTIFGKPLGVRVRKQLLDLYNQRPDNIHGNMLRILILDKGFKEGIDLFDVKYVHLFEPLITPSDERQAVGRATRYCGQKGLHFDPVLGWQLHVFKYDVAIAPGKTMHQVFMDESGIDMRRINFARELHTIAREAAVDAELTAPIHAFNILDSSPPPIIPYDAVARSAVDYKAFAKSIQSQARKTKTVGGDASQNTVITMIKSVGRPKAPTKKMSFEKMREFIRSRYALFQWPQALLENQCVPLEEVEGGANPAFIQLNPSQNFLRHYFDPSSAYKGILAWHSVGTGKTCAAIATATTGFESRGYTILWVTRHTLKSDIYKNLFDKICSVSLRTKMQKEGYQLPPNAHLKPRKYLPNNWILPISYRQFSNALAGKNRLYQQLVQRNGKEDILRNTLLIIDEAHKLYAPDVVGSEKPNTQLIIEKIKESYLKSQKESVRVMLMSGTPYTNDPMHLIKLLNILRDPQTDSVLPETFEAFQKAYLTKSGTFSKDGETTFKDDITGYISYLNREKDARQFAYPVFQDRVVDMSSSEVEHQRNLILVQQDVIDEWEQEIKEANSTTVKKLKAEMKEAIAKAQELCKEDHPPKSKERKECEATSKKKTESRYADLIADANDKLLIEKEELKAAKQKLRETKKEITAAKKTDKSQEFKAATRCKMDLALY